MAHIWRWHRREHLNWKSSFKTPSRRELRRLAARQRRRERSGEVPLNRVFFFSRLFCCIRNASSSVNARAHFGLKGARFRSYVGAHVVSAQLARRLLYTPSGGTQEGVLFAHARCASRSALHLTKHFSPQLCTSRKTTFAPPGTPTNLTEALFPALSPEPGTRRPSRNPFAPDVPPCTAWDTAPPLAFGDGRSPGTGRRGSYSRSARGRPACARRSCFGAASPPGSCAPGATSSAARRQTAWTSTPGRPPGTK